MAHEKTYDRRAAKGRGESDMDVDALIAEKSEKQQAQQAAPTEPIHEDYTDAEWIDYEAQLQDELDWLGARKGKSKGKGDRRKGKGKGKDFGKGGGGGGSGQGYGNGNGGATGCTWCGNENHWRADCEKLKKHKADKDADRKRNRSASLCSQAAHRVLATAGGAQSRSPDR